METVADFIFLGSKITADGDCSHEIKEVEKTTRQFMSDLNQILCDYTVDVRNRFNGLNLIDRVPDEPGQRFVTLYRRQGSRPSPWKRNAKKQNVYLRRNYK